MRTAPKVVLSLLISILLFSGLAAAAYAGLFNILETRFYQPAVISSMEGQLEATAEAMKTWHVKNTETFAGFVSADSVKRTLLPNQSAQDIFERSNLAGTLMADMPGLDGIRIIDAGDATMAPENDKGTRRIHFSTFKEDILKKEDLQISYENYGRSADDIPFAALSVPDGSPPKLMIETAKDRFLYCYPFYDAYSSWRGTAVFYVSARAAAQYLIGENLFRISDSLVLLGDQASAVSGTVTGMPRAGQQILGDAVLERWKRKDFTTDRIVSTDDSGWVLLSREAGDFGFTGQLVQESLFTFPQSVRILFLAISFLTVFLVIFLLFNLKQDEMMLIRNRIKRFHAHLLNELMDKNEEVHWDEIKKNLSNRKHDIASEIKKSFGRRMNKKHGTEIDALLDKSWDEILSALGQQESRQAGVTSTDELRVMLEQVLQNNAISLNLSGVPHAAKPKKHVPAAIENKPNAAGESEDVEELDDMEAVDEIEEVADAETAEEIDEIDEIDEIEAVEELDEVEAVEELDEIGEATDAKTAEEIDEIEAVEELDEVAEATEAETAEEIDEVEAVEELDEIGEATDAETVEEIDEIEAVEELDEVAEATEAETAEELDETAEVTKAESAEALGEAPIEFPDVLPDMNSIIEGFTDPSAEIVEEDFLLADVEPEEVEYLDGEWEPALLEIASEEELARFIEEKIPDSILVYNFEEPRMRASAAKAGITEAESEIVNSVSIIGLDFTSLDSSGMEDAEEVDYIDTFLFSQTVPLRDEFEDIPAYDFLEVLGDEEPAELLEVGDGLQDEDGSVTNRDGLFLVAARPVSGSDDSIDAEFQKLVDSVLL